MTSVCFQYSGDVRLHSCNLNNINLQKDYTHHKIIHSTTSPMIVAEDADIALTFTLSPILQSVRGNTKVLFC